MKRLGRTVLCAALVFCLVLALTACDIGTWVEDLLSGILEDMPTEEEESLKPSSPDKQKTDVGPAQQTVSLQDGDLSFHFLTLGNKYTGDSTYVKYGDVDILIDAGSRYDSAESIVDYVKSYCTDGKLEYVIATHAHQDHIAGFVGNEKASAMSAFKVGTIIDFPLTNATSKVYENYCAARDTAVRSGAKHYTALDCYNNKGGAQRTYTLGEGVSMQILYNYYYDHKTSNENDYSVCVLFSYGDNHYLFTGDLEEKGEQYLVKYNQLPYVKLFKGGHHGSYTANSELLMQTIQPDVVCVCCCCGTPEYTTKDVNMFPSQTFFDHVLPYTDQIYVTSMVADMDEEALARGDDEVKYGFTDMNGNIVVVAHGDKLDVYCSADTTPVPQTEWFAKHRTRPAS